MKRLPPYTYKESTAQHPPIHMLQREDNMTTRTDPAEIGEREQLADKEKQLDWRLKRLRDITERDLYIERAYGAPRLYEGLELGGARELSPRLPDAQLVDWLDAMLQGLELHPSEQ